MASLERALVFIGFMGAGKSTAAAEVADELGVRALDADALLEAQLGHSIAREFELGGEARFRELEERVVCEVLDPDARARTHARVGVDLQVVALGGGAVLSERVRAALRPHVTVLLDVESELAWERVCGERRGGGEERPLARDPAAFAALHAARRPLYEELADAILPAQRPGVARRALPALRALAATQAPAPMPRMLWAAAASGEYPVLVGRGLLDPSGSPEIWELGTQHPTGAAGCGHAFCVTDETVAALYAPPLRATHPPIAIPPGEAHKTLASAERVWRELAVAGMTRADHLVALGGGVVGDLAGFCAATYQRGVPVVQAPTTLVAQVDSAYGGKTGIDLPEAKNYVGAYHQPAAVIVDPDALRTLPAAELGAGWAEVLKTALIAGGELWERIAADEPVDERTILECARLKLSVVAADERDGGRRQVLNLGHTIGHAIETATGYTRYRHGEAVGLGLLAALRLSGQARLRAQVRELLLAHDLPVSLRDSAGAHDGAGGLGVVDLEAVLAAVAHDKKRVGEHVPFVLLDAPGETRVGCKVAPEELRAAVAELADATEPPLPPGRL
ncbi:MAG TPA: bifunctional shikimate kinase/3-dehydroquinate synthase [Solirubrobacteraceae bacterium]|nr:bifunctional shikimate kinase/3-dehydroquinate synthase [Solirubrobacteraceae bacterium]